MQYSDITVTVVAMVHFQSTNLLRCPLQVGKTRMTKEPVMYNRIDDIHFHASPLEGELAGLAPINPIALGGAIHTAKPSPQVRLREGKGFL